jgi:adenylate cyclase
MITTAASFYQTGGTLRPDAPSYVERQADRDLYEGLARGEFCYVLTARQMGKCSLMARAATRHRGKEHRSFCGRTGHSRAQESGEDERWNG